MVKKVITIIMTLAVMFEAAGCVSQSKYDDLAEELTSVKMQYEQAEKEIETLKMQNEGYINRIDELKAENESIKAETSAQVAAADDGEAVSQTYIGNKKSKKFHLPTCGGLPEAQNRIEFNSREDAINAGMQPCRRCNP